MDYHREITPAAYGADYAQNLRWRYRTYYGGGRNADPYRGGGSYGRGYHRAEDLGARSADPGPPPRPGYAAPYYGRHPGGYRYRRRGRGRGRTAARYYGEGYPYFASSAIAEAAQGYPPADTLNPEVYPPALGAGVGDYGDEYEPPGVVADRWRGDWYPEPRGRERTGWRHGGRRREPGRMAGRGRRARPRRW